MTFKELVLKNRSYRRFHENEAISREQLAEWVDLARNSASGGNAQPLKYLLSADPKTNELIFPSLKWAGALPDWPGPSQGERPAAYIVILLDKSVSQGAGCDHGIAAQTILLGAVEKGYGGCMLGAINRDALRRDLRVPEGFDILLALALGRPNETIVLEPLPASGSTKYYRDAQSVHHVPKRSLDEIIVSF